MMSPVGKPSWHVSEHPREARITCRVAAEGVKHVVHEHVCEFLVGSVPVIPVGSVVQIWRPLTPVSRFAPCPVPFEHSGHPETELVEDLSPAENSIRRRRNPPVLERCIEGMPEFMRYESTGDTSATSAAGNPGAAAYTNGIASR